MVASPEVFTRIAVPYSTVGGVGPVTFGGRLTTPVNLIGSLFFGQLDATLAETVLGPYTFGTLPSQERGVPAPTGAPLDTPRLLSSADIDARADGTAIAIEVRDTHDPVGIEVELNQSRGGVQFANLYLTIGPSDDALDRLAVRAGDVLRARLTDDNGQAFEAQVPVRLDLLFRGGFE